MSKLCPVAVASDPTVTDESQPDSVLDSHLLLLKQKRLCDVVFTFENSTEQIEAHQLYLRERSPVFELIFRTSKPSANGGKRVIDVADATLATFWNFLKFIYADEFHTTIAGALDLLYLARKYQVDPLKKKCEALMKTEFATYEALEVFEAAYRYGKQDLMEKAGDLLAKNMDSLWPQLMGAQEFTINYLFRRDDLLTVRECDVFKFLLSWGKNRQGRETDLKAVLTSLIPLVRFTCMTPYEFTTVVVPTGLLSAEDIVQVYSFFGSDPASRSEIGTNWNFSVAPREAEVVEMGIRFYSEPTVSWSHVGEKPLKECTSFMAKIGAHPSPKVWSEFSVTRPSIKGIMIRWPLRAVQNTDIKDNNLNFSVAVNWCIGQVRDNNIEVKFSRVLAQRAHGQFEEIIVEPPVELTNGIKYCITVEDLSAHADKPTISSSTENHPPTSVRFTYCAPNKVEWIRNSSFNMQNWPIELLDVEQNSNLTGFGNYGDLQLVVGVLIGLV